MRHVPPLRYSRGRGIRRFRGVDRIAPSVLEEKLVFPNLSSKQGLKCPLESAVSLESAYPWTGLRNRIDKSKLFIEVLAKTPRARGVIASGIVKSAVRARSTQISTQIKNQPKAKTTKGAKYTARINPHARSRNTRVAGRATAQGKAKVSKAITRFKAQGRQRTQKPFGYNKMRSHIQFITTPTSDTPGTALLLHFDDKRYIVGNVHEGLQRAGLQVGARFFKAKDFFLTGRTEWQKNGGLLGMILTLADSTNASASARAEALKLKAERAMKREEEGLQSKQPAKKASSNTLRKDAKSMEEDPTVTLHGGPNLTHMVATARSFVFRKGTPMKIIEHDRHSRVGTIELDWEPTWADNRIQVWAMAITPTSGDDSYTNPRPASPRKRSLGEYMKGERPSPSEVANQWSIQPSASDAQAEQDQRIREFVVSEMFGSEWRYDNLVETSLHQVKMPASIFIRDSQTHRIEKYTGPTPDGTTPVPNIKVLVRQPWPGALVDHLPPAKLSATSMSYIIRNHKQRGKFRPAVAKELNVPTGPLWAALAAGENVHLEDGKIITPDMVLEPSKEGNGFAIVELPSKEYVQDLVARPEWKAEKPMAGFAAIVWLLGADVARDDTLITFMKEHSEWQHIISSPDRCPDYLTMTSAASAAIRHHQVDPARYPIPVHDNRWPILSDTLLENPDSRSLAWLPAKRGLKLQLEPTFAVDDKDLIPYLNTAQVVWETSDEVIRLGQVAQHDVSKASTQISGVNQDLPGQDAEIICLGTGSAMPSQHRNVSGTLLRVPGSGSYLLDCGENTLGQLKRIYSKIELAEVLRDLKMIWISHLHADHHLGTASVVKAWYEEVHGVGSAKRPRPSLTEQLLSPEKFLEEGKRLFVVGHHNMLRWLQEYSSVEDFGYNQIVPLKPSPAAWSKPDLGPLEWNGMQVGFNTAKDSWVKSAIRKATGLSNLVTAQVNHCYGALAVSLTFPTGFKFSYSGDCRPSRDFAVIGKGSTVLLHEATFDDDLKGDAHAKKHSTTSEAIGVGAAMGARRVILTHFSQRYQKIPSMNSMNSLSVQLEDAEQSEEAANAPVDEPMAPAVEFKAPISNLLEGLDKATPTPQTENTSPDPQSSPQNPSTASSGAFSSLTNFSTLIQPTPKVAPLDMKIGVAFDYMRVKVGDIIHLEKFNAAMRELYKDAEEDEKARKAKAVAFSDKGVKGEPANLAGEDKERTREEERAEKARKGQARAARRKDENTAKWEREKAEKAIPVTDAPPREVKMRDSLTFDPSVLIEKIHSKDPSPIRGRDRPKEVESVLPSASEMPLSSDQWDAGDEMSSSGEDAPDRPLKRRSSSYQRRRVARKERRAAVRQQEEKTWKGRSGHSNADPPEAMSGAEDEGERERAVQ